tara:strand:+ start:734 stop:916 length:183 start_codon:yes stop_codon:yes gene_type:complete
MKKILCRHKDEEQFKVSGYGTIEEQDETEAVVRWLVKGNKNLIKKSYLYILDESQKNGFK